MKSVLIRSFFRSVFSCIRSEYGVNVRIQSECGKIRTTKNSVFGHFSWSVSGVNCFQKSFMRLCDSVRYKTNIMETFTDVWFKTETDGLDCTENQINIKQRRQCWVLHRWSFKGALKLSLAILMLCSLKHRQKLFHFIFLKQGINLCDTLLSCFEKKKSPSLHNFTMFLRTSLHTLLWLEFYFKNLMLRNSCVFKGTFSLENPFSLQLLNFPNFHLSEKMKTVYSRKWRIFVNQN